jgi:hypothetical protein
MSHAVKSASKVITGAVKSVGGAIGLGDKGHSPKPAPEAPKPIPTAPGAERSAAKAELMANRRSQVSAVQADDGAVGTGNDADLLGASGQMLPRRKSASAKYLGG